MTIDQIKESLGAIGPNVHYRVVESNITLDDATGKIKFISEDGSIKLEPTGKFYDTYDIINIPVSRKFHEFTVSAVPVDVAGWYQDKFATMTIPDEYISTFKIDDDLLEQGKQKFENSQLTRAGNKN